MAEEEPCAICYEDMGSPPQQVGDGNEDGAVVLTKQVVKLPCGHCFHKNCATWQIMEIWFGDGLGMILDLFFWDDSIFLRKVPCEGLIFTVFWEI